MAESVIIIGSGFGGLGAAIRLAARGFDVQIFEKLDKPGGRGYTFRMDGFSFDADDLFELAGRRREDYVICRNIRIFDGAKHMQFPFDIKEYRI